ncbi:hypothetical protein EDC01DRAFT_638006 [Geopyxis carbonaria]|nr:hypothetical protein EDC01DRAFT_638006 [Geopyxis carbonaria]
MSEPVPSPQEILDTPKDVVATPPKDIAATPAARGPVSRKLHSSSAFISHINKLLSTQTGIDRTLSLLYYICTFLAPQFVRAAQRHLVLRNLKVKLPSAATLTSTAVRLRAAAARISDARMFLRLWGLFGITEWGVKTLRSPPADTVEKYLVLAQVGVNTVFQVLENAAYLNMHGVLAIADKARERQMWLWSTRMWAAHIVLEFLRLERVRAVRKKTKTIVDVKIVGDDDKAARESWRKSFVGNMMMAPLSWHWSTEKGLIDDTTVGLFGGYAAAVSFMDAWRSSA